jgi:hypothetical protein
MEVSGWHLTLAVLTPGMEQPVPVGYEDRSASELVPEHGGKIFIVHISWVVQFVTIL